MTWTEKLDKLIDASELLFIDDEANIESLLTSDHTEELVAYLELDVLKQGPLQKSWTIAVFLHVLAKYSRGERISLTKLLSEMSDGLQDMSSIEEAIKVLEIKQILAKKNSKFRPRLETNIEVIPFTIDKIMLHFPLPIFTLEEINAKKLLLILRDQGFDLHDFGLKEVQNILDEYCKTNNFSFIEKLDAYKSIKGELKYLMILLIIQALSFKGDQIMRMKSGSSLPVNINRVVQQLFKGDSKLIELGLVDAEYLDFTQEVQLSLTYKAIDKFGLEKSKSNPKEKTGGYGNMPHGLKDQPEQDFFKIIPNKLIESEALFYNQRLNEALDFYKKLFNKEDKIFKGNPTIKGRMILMFDGLPGTGKTAAAIQLAKESNRDLIHVNWQTFRGQFVGESEKNLQELLNDIDRIALKYKRIPVVLFNEAEAFLSQRIAINQSTDRMENNLVSMLLEWLEKKDPFCIVIFTSNYRQLMDKAFERRISHITFDVPDEHTRLRIWKALSTGISLSPEECVDLSYYPLTGAEISRVLNTYCLHQIAYGAKGVDIKKLHNLCVGQKWMEQKSSIGFKTLA